MKNKYIDLIDQTYYFPQDEFTLDGDELRFHNIDLMELVRKYGAPLKFMYLPRISENIQRAKKWFEKAIKKHKYKGAYNYCYCTKSSHFKHVMVEALKNDIHMETSSAFDINIINNLISEGLITKENYICVMASNVMLILMALPILSIVAIKIVFQLLITMRKSICLKKK